MAEDKKTVGGQRVIDNVPLRHECKGASDWCMHCDVNMCGNDPRASDPCMGLERARRCQIDPATIVAFGCDKEAKGGTLCAQWCQGERCAYTRGDAAATGKSRAPGIRPTPAQHPDTVRLEWLMNQMRDSVTGMTREAIDATRAGLLGTRAAAATPPSQTIHSADTQGLAAAEAAQGEAK